MVRFTTIFNSGWWGQGGKNAQDDTDLSPQIMKTTIDRAASKKNDFGFGKQANETVKILLEMSMAHQSVKDMMKCHSLPDTLDTKTSTEGHNITCDSPSTAGNVENPTQAGYEDDSSTIVSSSSSAVFELFDDVSILTNEDSLFDNSDIDALNVDSLIPNERIAYDGSMAHSQFAFFSGVNFEKGFTPSDELRMGWTND